MIRLFRSFHHAFRGIMSALSQTNLRIHVAAAILVMAAGFYCDIEEGEWLAVVLAIGLVISLELMNTALEHLVDLVSPQHHDLAGKVKDIAAGAVLVASAVAAVIGVMIFWKYLFGM